MATAVKNCENQRLSDKFREFVKVRTGEISLEKIYKAVLEETEYHPSELIEMIQLTMFKIEMCRGGAVHPSIASTIASMSGYVEVLANEHPDRKRELTKHELLYIIAKIDTILNHSESLNGLKILPPSPTEEMIKNGFAFPSSCTIANCVGCEKDSEKRSPPPGMYS
jgi:hypothetical protein